MAYNKPCLMPVNANTDYNDFTPEMVEGHFQPCLFYGFWPSMFTNLACDWFYRQGPELSARDRRLAGSAPSALSALVPPRTVRSASPR